ncbi:MAG TPA: hypothetical protein VKH37_02325, partial [Ferruginibacter sp.]|nr:hypothetical protein [Ferruginibacter sp.]
MKRTSLIIFLLLLGSAFPARAQSRIDDSIRYYTNMVRAGKDKLTSYIKLAQFTLSADSSLPYLVM